MKTPHIHIHLSKTLDSGLTYSSKAEAEADIRNSPSNKRLAAYSRFGMVNGKLVTYWYLALAPGGEVNSRSVSKHNGEREVVMFMRSSDIPSNSILRRKTEEASSVSFDNTVKRAVELYRMQEPGAKSLQVAVRQASSETDCEWNVPSVHRAAYRLAAPMFFELR